jgi:hypothetical protein
MNYTLKDMVCVGHVAAPGRDETKMDARATVAYGYVWHGVEVFLTKLIVACAAKERD